MSCATPSSASAALVPGCRPRGELREPGPSPLLDLPPIRRPPDTAPSPVRLQGPRQGSTEGTPGQARRQTVGRAGLPAGDSGNASGPGNGAERQHDLEPIG